MADERGLIVYEEEQEIRDEMDSIGLDGAGAELTPGPRGGFVLTGEDAEAYANHRGLVTTELKDIPGYSGEIEPLPPENPGIASLTPAEAVAGAADTVVAIAGSGFESGAVATYDGSDTVTTFTDASNLSFTAPTSTAVEGIFEVTVRNPSGGVSPGVSFTITPVVGTQSRRRT